MSERKTEWQYRFAECVDDKSYTLQSGTPIYASEAARRAARELDDFDLSDDEDLALNDLDGGETVVEVRDGDKWRKFTVHCEVIRRYSVEEDLSE